MLPGMFRRASRPTKTGTKKFVRLELEALESRVVPTTVMVTNTSGDAATAGSLPFEVAQSNANGGYTIQFSNLFNTPQTINLASEMNVTAPLVVDGPGANLLTIAPATGNNRVFSIASGTNPTTISGVTLSNTTGGTAEAIYDFNSDLTVLKSVITGFNNTNSNGYRGGASFLHLPATLTIGYSTISGNSTTGFGGGIGVNNGGTENIYESTITGNTATGSLGGGGIYLWGTNTATIKNSTIAGNSAPNSTRGGGISEVNFSGNTLILDSTIVGQNTDQSNTAPDINQDSGSTLVAYYSLIGSNAGIPTITGANNQTDVSPGFTTFTPSNNGGPTPTLALPAGSPALTAGTANRFANDQRGAGFPRTVNGATDIGAFQTQVAPTVTGISPTSGPRSGGTSVTITGTNFTGVTAVNFGATPAASFTVNSATSITAITPAGSGTVDVTVLSSGITSATLSADQFTFTTTPSPSAPSPPAPTSLNAPFPLPLAVLLGNQQLNNQIGLALSWQALLTLPGADANLMQAIVTGPLLDFTLAAEEFHLAYDLALFVNAPSTFSPSSPLTWLLAMDVVSTSTEIARDPLVHTPAGFMESTEVLALDLHNQIANPATQQAAIAALQQTPTLGSLLNPLLKALSSIPVT